MYSKSLHIVDALMLGGVDISGYPLNERLVFDYTHMHNHAILIAFLYL